MHARSPKQSSQMTPLSDFDVACRHETAGIATVSPLILADRHIALLTPAQACSTSAYKTKALSSRRQMLSPLSLVLQDLVSHNQIMQMVPYLASALGLATTHVQHAVTKTVAHLIEDTASTSPKTGQGWQLQLAHECR